MFKFFKQKQKPQKLLIVLGTDFGSYQFNQLVDASDEYQVVGFISDDPWQKKSGFGKVGVFDSLEIKGLCESQEIIAIILPSDQKETWLASESSNHLGSGGTESDENPLLGLEDKIKYCDILTIQPNVSTNGANRYLSELICS